MPEGTDVSSLIPIVEYTDGATITPEAGTSVDFTNPITYSLDYLGSVFNYEVTVILGDEPTPILVLYNGEDVSPTWESIASSVNNGTVNPVTDGINSTSTCVSLLRTNTGTDDGGKPWTSGVLWNANQVNVDPAIYGSITVMVLKMLLEMYSLKYRKPVELNKDWLHADYSADHVGECKS